jgi:hypothetical protein
VFVASRPVIFGFDTQQLGLDVDELVELASALRMDGCLPPALFGSQTGKLLVENYTRNSGEYFSKLEFDVDEMACFENQMKDGTSVTGYGCGGKCHCRWMHVGTNGGQCFRQFMPEGHC